MNKNILLSLGTLLLASWGAVPAVAQVLYGSIVGRVVDPTQAAVPDVTVTVKDDATNFTRQATTNEVGAYTIATVPAGVYELTLTKAGFGATSRKGVEVSINSVTRVDLTVQVGTVATSIEVSAGVAALQTDRAEVRTDVTSKQLGNLPIPPGRNYQSLFKMIPGISPPANGNSVVADPSRSLIFSANGSSRNSNNMRIDGSGVNSVWLPQNAAYVPTLEAIETVNVVTNSFDAEQGLAGGSATNVLIKSGGNQMHGSAFEFHNDNATKARPFFLPANQGKPKAVFNQFGGTFGGPSARISSSTSAVMRARSITNSDPPSQPYLPMPCAAATSPVLQIRFTTR